MLQPQVATHEHMSRHHCSQPKRDRPILKNLRSSYGFGIKNIATMYALSRFCIIETCTLNNGIYLLMCIVQKNSGAKTVLKLC